MAKAATEKYIKLLRKSISSGGGGSGFKGTRIIKILYFEYIQTIELCGSDYAAIKKSPILI